MPALRSRSRRIVLSALVALCCSAPPLAFAADKPESASAGGIDAARFFSAIVKLEVRALPDARSAATLGTEREGSGIVIDQSGLILTIGYLVVEADEVKVIDGRGRSLPASVVAYDHVSGLALVRPIAPLAASPLPLGDSTRLAESDPVLVVNYEGRNDFTVAYVAARREFTGSWEYLLERAIFTSPPTLNWSGAALIDKDGALVGVGSLILRDVTEKDPHLPGNMFVPVEVLKPILPDLVRSGRRAGPARPWLGMNADEVHGRLLVTRVSPDGPADRAGVEAGDIVLGVNGEPVRTQAEFYRKVWSRGAAGSEIPLRVQQGNDVHDIKVRSIDRLEYFRQKPTY